jgi:integrase
MDMSEQENPTEKTEKKKGRRIGQREEVAKGKHIIRVFLGRDTVTGKRHYHSETFLGGARQAEDRIREIIRRHRAGEPIKANADTFGNLLDEWIESKKLSVAESSLKTYREKIDWYIRPTLGQKLLARVMAEDIQRLYGKLHDDGLSRATIHFVHTILGMVFKLAVKRKKLIGSPMAGVELPKEQTGDQDEPEERAMTPDQVAKFLAAAEGSRFDNLFKLAFHVGCRPGELLALKWADLDANARTLRINQNIVWRNSKEWYLKKPKTRLSRRTLPLTDALIEVLGAQRKRQLEARLKVGKLWTDHGFIFANEVGEPYSQGTLLNDCKRILKAAGLPATFKPYTARHTMATLLIAGGTNPKAVSERLGHSNVTITLQTYTHVNPGMQGAVSEEIERLLGGQK